MRGVAVTDAERLLRAVAQCAIGETMAAIFLESSLEVTRGLLVRAAVRELLSDDIDHARIGWALLAASSTKLRKDIEPWILPTMKAYVRLWSDQTPWASAPGLREHGLPAPAETAADARRAACEVIVPGFTLLGMAPRSLTEWAANGCPV